MRWSRRTTSRLLLAICSAGCVSGFALASRSAEPNQRLGTAGRSAPLLIVGAKPETRPAARRENQVEIWPEVEQFMDKHSHRKWEMYKALPEKQKGNLKNGIINRYRGLKQIEHQDKERYAYELQTIQLEDEIYGILQDMRTGETGDDQQARNEIQSRVEQLVDSRLKWRQVQVSRIETELRSLRLPDTAEQLRQEETMRWSAPETRQRMIERRMDEFLQHARPPRKELLSRPKDGKEKNFKGTGGGASRTKPAD